MDCALAKQPDTAAVAEFDVEDCFLNTPRDEVLQMVDFCRSCYLAVRAASCTFRSARTTKLPTAYRMRRSYSTDWDVSSDLIAAIVRWEFTEKAVSNGRLVVLMPHRGLPIGGHLSAALGEFGVETRVPVVARRACFLCHFEVP